MTNTSVPRDLLERLADRRAFLHDTRKAQDELRALLAQPAAPVTEEALNGGQMPYGYLREVDGQCQLSIGPNKPADRAGGHSTPWAAIYAHPAVTYAKREREAESLLPEGWTTIAMPDGSYTVRSPRVNGVRAIQSVATTDADPAHALLAHILEQYIRHGA